MYSNCYSTYKTFNMFENVHENVWSFKMFLISLLTSCQRYITQSLSIYTQYTLQDPTYFKVQLSDSKIWKYSENVYKILSKISLTLWPFFVYMHLKVLHKISYCLKSDYKQKWSLPVSPCRMKEFFPFTL